MDEKKTKRNIVYLTLKLYKYTKFIFEISESIDCYIGFKMLRYSVIGYDILVCYIVISVL